MNIISWLIIGCLAGWIGSMVTRDNDEMGFWANLIVGIIGALIGGFIFNLIGGYGITGFNLWSLFVSVIGSIVLLWIIKYIKRI